MIALKRLNGTAFWLNPELIEQLDRTPDTVITLVTGNNIVVLEPVDVVVEKILDYRRKVRSDSSAATGTARAERGRDEKPIAPLPEDVLHPKKRG